MRMHRLPQVPSDGRQARRRRRSGLGVLHSIATHPDGLSSKARALGHVLHALAHVLRGCRVVASSDERRGVHGVRTMARLL